jgi:hypothetical protein
MTVISAIDDEKRFPGLTANSCRTQPLGAVKPHTHLPHLNLRLSTQACARNCTDLKFEAFVSRRVEELIDRNAAFGKALRVMLVKEVVEHFAVAIHAVRPKSLPIEARTSSSLSSMNGKVTLGAEVSDSSLNPTSFACSIAFKIAPGSQGY